MARNLEIYRLSTWVGLQDYKTFEERFVIENTNHPSSVMSALNNVATGMNQNSFEHPQKFIRIALDNNYNMSYRNNQFLITYIRGFNTGVIDWKERMEFILVIVESKNFKISDHVFSEVNNYIPYPEFWDKLFKLYEETYNKPVPAQARSIWFSNSYKLYENIDFINYCFKNKHYALHPSSSFDIDIFLNQILNKGGSYYPTEKVYELLGNIINNRIELQQPTLKYLYESNKILSTEVLFDMNIPIPSDFINTDVGVKYLKYMINKNKKSVVMTPDEKDFIDALL